MTPTVRYPAGPITPHGAYHILAGRLPNMALSSWDNTVVFNLLGGLAIHDPTRPERVQVTSLDGLIPPWNPIKQKGATQDGSTFVTALYDETEINLTVKVVGRNPQERMRVHRTLINSVDAIRESRLSWWTHDLGYWWAPVRWFRTPSTPMAGLSGRSQDVDLRLAGYDAFWRSYDHVSSFKMKLDSIAEPFNYATEPGLGPNWTLQYYGPGGGHIYADGFQARWRDDPDDTILSEGRRVVARRVGFETETDNQVIETTFGTFAEWSFPRNAENTLWARMPLTGSAGGNGICLTIELDSLKLSYFINGVEKKFASRQIIIPPLPGERWRLVAGYEGNPRLYKVFRGDVEVMSFKEKGTDSLMGAAYRGAGMGMRAAGALITQATPASVREWSAGDNATVTQSGYVDARNAGDQPQFLRYICFGPGVFRFSNGVNSTDKVEFGPLLQNQIMEIYSDPRKRTVIDMTQKPPTPQDLTKFQKAIKDFLSFASGNNASPLLQEIESNFGILPPQGHPYSLLKGRFSDAAAIPPKSPGLPIETHKVAVEIDEGNADSAIIAIGTPLRRYPI